MTSIQGSLIIARLFGRGGLLGSITLPGVFRYIVAPIAFALLLSVSAACTARKAPPPPPQTEAKAPPEPVLPEKPLTQAQIAVVQSTLAKRGYQPGPADGKMGLNTSRAIAHYQQDSGLKVDGTATSSLLRHMMEQPNVAPKVIAVEAAIPSGLYPVGTRFVYSGVETHTVTGVDGGRVNWETSLGDHYTTGPHFGLPEKEWQSGTWKGVAESSLPPETSWPPNEGMDLYFDVTSQEWNEAQGKNAQRHASDASWSCSNEGAKGVKVPAGSFKALAIICERSPAPAGAWQKRVWYYVPAIGHFVRRHDFDGAGLEIAMLELIAILPGGGSRTLRKGRQGAIHDVLDRAAPGTETVWRNPVGTESYVIRVNGGYDGPGGKPCRTYSVTKQRSLPRREYPAVACKGEGKRRWIIPGLD
jgi:peptidoglycan hydrolase-like protein with peptidoglycan-binding domain